MVHVHGPLPGQAPLPGVTAKVCVPQALTWLAVNSLAVASVNENDAVADDTYAARRPLRSVTFDGVGIVM
jgi:hypothetical protein